MQLIHLLAAGLVPALASALSRRDVECNFFTTPDYGATCASFASGWGISVRELQALNPGVTCPALDPTQSYCIVGTVIDPPATTLTTTTSSTTTTTTTQPPITTTSPTGPTPTMPGISNNCDGFYKISSGDLCDTIAQRHGITVAQLRSWNSEIDAGCSNLWLGYYICVHVAGAQTTSSTTVTTTTSATVPGPTPQQPGIVSNCNKYHLVKSGDDCTSIAIANGISVANFYNWNPAVGSSCASLWLGYYVCVGTTTFQPTTTTTVTGPSPTQSGMIKTCTKHYRAQAGDTCDVIIKEKFPYVNLLSLFVRWNPAVGSTCSNLLTGYYYCVATELHQPMPGIVSNCRRYYQVKAGDSCWSIQQQYAITAAQFDRWNPLIGSSCGSLWQGYFICIGV